MIWIKIPAGHVSFLGGWRRWIPVLVIWWTAKPAIELRGLRWRLKFGKR